MSKQGKAKRKLIEEALEIYPNTTDAYLLLAEEADTLEEHQALLRKAIAVGEADLGKQYFKENKGHFWGLIETRPYMRAKASYAIALEQAGFIEEAIQHYEALLELNPNDNQGIRDLLLPLYIFIGNFDQAKKLLHTYETDITATFLFNKALVIFLTEGVTNKALKLLDEADDRNPYVLDYLFKIKRIPNEAYDYIQLGDETEAITYAQGNIHLWEDAQEFLEAYINFDN